jgi:hypothetical protein
MHATAASHDGPRETRAGTGPFRDDTGQWDTETSKEPLHEQAQAEAETDT